MSRLGKVAQPLFGGDTTAADQEVAVFGTMKTGSPTYSVNVSTLLASPAYTGGWADAVEVGYAPFMEEMNGIQLGFSYQIAYQMQEGIPEWDGDTTYYIGSIAKLVTETGFKLYSSIVDNNTGNLLTDTTKWKLWWDSDVGYVGLSASRAIVTDANGKMVSSAVTSTELGYLSGSTSNLQTQINAKFNSVNIQKVQTLPSTTDPDTYYFVTG